MPYINILFSFILTFFCKMHLNISYTISVWFSFIKALKKWKLTFPKCIHLWKQCFFHYDMSNWAKNCRRSGEKKKFNTADFIMTKYTQHIIIYSFNFFLHSLKIIFHTIIIMIWIMWNNGCGGLNLTRTGHAQYQTWQHGSLKMGC